MSGTLRTPDQLKAIRARVLAFTDGDGDTVNVLAGGRVYVNRPPDNVAFPCVVLRKVNAQSSIEFSNSRVDFDIEAMVYSRPGSSEQTAEVIADLIEAALLTWKESSPTLGLSFGRRSMRDTMEIPGETSDREYVGIRLLVNCISWPRYLTDALAAS